MPLHNIISFQETVCQNPPQAKTQGVMTNVNRNFCNMEEEEGFVVAVSR